VTLSSEREPQDATHAVTLMFWARAGEPGEPLVSDLYLKEGLPSNPEIFAPNAVKVSDFDGAVAEPDDLRSYCIHARDGTVFVAHWGSDALLNHKVGVYEGAQLRGAENVYVTITTGTTTVSVIDIHVRERSPLPPWLSLQECRSAQDGAAHLEHLMADVEGSDTSHGTSPPAASKTEASQQVASPEASAQSKLKTMGKNFLCAASSAASSIISTAASSTSPATVPPPRKGPCKFGMQCRNMNKPEHCRLFTHEKQPCRFGTRCRSQNDPKHTALFHH